MANLALIAVAKGQPPQLVCANPAWSATGDRLVYDMNATGRPSLFQVRANGSANQPISDFRSADSNARWSPDGRRLAFVSDRSGGQLDVFVGDALGKEAVNISNEPGQQTDPAWSPDGRHLAYASRPVGASAHDIVIAEADGRNPRRLEFAGSDERAPAFSPDGRSIAFESDRSGTPEIHVASLDGTGLRSLTPKVASRRPSWGPDGRIVFESARDGNPEIYVMDADGGRVRRLTNSADDDRMPSWSKDGSRIAFASSTDAGGRIMVMPSAGGAAICVAGACNKVTDGVPSFSPDGRQLAFVRITGESSEIVLVDVRTGEERPLTSGATRMFRWRPTWSPDGRFVLFSTRRQSETSVSVVEVANKTERVITSEPGDQTAVWSPDGRQIALASGRPPAVTLYTVSPDGSARRPLLAGDPAFSYWPSWVNGMIAYVRRDPKSGRLGLALLDVAAGTTWPVATSQPGQSAALSPDGKWIAFQSSVESGNTDILIIGADGTGERRLTTDPGLDETPSWSPDGRTIAFQSDRTGEMRVYLMNADGGAQRMVRRK